MSDIEIPLVDICGVRLPRVLLGNSTFIYGTSYNPVKAFWRSIKFYQFPNNITKLLVKAINYGVTGIQLFSSSKLVDATQRAEQKTGVDLKMLGVVGTMGRNIKYHPGIDYVSKLKPELLAPWVAADFLRRSPFTDERIKKLEEILQHIRRIGAVPGLSTHFPVDVIPKIDDSGLDVNFYLVPFNKIGFQMRPNREAVMKTVRKTDKPVVAIKSLAWGRIPPKEAFKFIFESGPAAAAVGIASEKELVKTFSAASEVLGESINVV